MEKLMKGEIVSEVRPSNWIELRTILLEKANNYRLFRGESNSKWELKSSISRVAQDLNKDVTTLESGIIREFKRGAQNYRNSLPEKYSTFEWLSLMQHSRIPTRLIDFTKSPWVALYFALEGAKQDQSAAIYCLDLKTDRECYLRSKFLIQANQRVDVNVIIGNLSRDEDVVNNPNNYLLQFSSPAGNTTAPIGITIDEGYFAHERLIYQQGLFVFQFDIRVPFFENIADEMAQGELLKIIIEPHLFEEAIKELQHTNCNAQVLFGGFDGFCRGLPYKVYTHY